MKNYFTFMLLILLMLGISSCAKNPCRNANCPGNSNCNRETGECDCDPGYTKDAKGYCTLCDECYHGMCASNLGACSCDDGYELDSVGKCRLEVREKYMGTYKVTEQGQNPALAPYFVTMSKGLEYNQVVMTGHGGYACGTTGEPVVMNGIVRTSFGGDTYHLDFSENSRYCGTQQLRFWSFSGIRILNNSFTVNYIVSSISTGNNIRSVTATFVKQ